MSENYTPDIVGFFPGVWDLLHAGHVAALALAKERCNVLIVGLQTDPTIDRPKNKPIQSVYERYAQLRACRYVSEIVPYETESDLVNILTTMPMHVRFCSEEYDGHVTGQTQCEALGIKILKLPRRHNFSSSELRQRIIDLGMIGNGNQHKPIY